MAAAVKRASADAVETIPAAAASVLPPSWDVSLLSTVCPPSSSPSCFSRLACSCRDERRCSNSKYAGTRFRAPLGSQGSDEEA